MSGAVAGSSGPERGATMGLEDKIPAGFGLATVEGLVGYFRKASLWPVTMG